MGPIHLINPAMLYLAAAAVLPLIIHLLSRRRTRNVRFTTVGFLRRTARRSIARVNLKHLLLMLLRMALICLLALVLARPLVGGGPKGPDRPLAGASAAVILDDSLSMNHRRGDVSWFERARNRALEVLAQLPAGAEVAVTTTSQPAMLFTRDGTELRARLTSMRASFGGGSCWAALERAGGALRERAAGMRVIYLLTDMTRSAWLGLGEASGAGAPMLDLGETVALEIVAVGDADASNTAVTRLSHEGEPLIQGAVLDLQTELLRTGPEAEEVVQFEFDGEMVGRRTVRLPADGTEKLSFRLPIEGPGHHWGRVSFLNADALPQDNARAFSIEVPGAISVLCVDEAAASGEPEGPSRSYFFRSALSPWVKPERGLFALKTVGLEELGKERLSGFDVVALLDSPGPSASVWERLADFVAGGGGLLVSAGPGVRPERYGSRQARKLLPAVFGDVVSAPGGAAGPFRMRVVKTAHPLVTSLDEAGVDLGRAALGKCRRLGLTEAGEEVLSFGEGLPALVMGRAGGRVAMFGGGLGVEWGDFPRRAAFVPFCQALVLYLAGADEARLSSFVVGQHVPVRFEPSSSPTVVAVTPPGSTEGAPLMPGTTPGRRLYWKTQAPGYYRVDFQQRGRQWSSGFCVNTSPHESDLRMVTESDVRAAIDAGRVAVHEDTSTLPAMRLGGGMAGWAGMELTPYLVLLALLACVAEVFLANRLYRASEAPQEPVPEGTRGQDV